MKFTFTNHENFWLLVSIALFVIIVGTAGIYAFQVLGASVVSQEGSAATISSQTQPQGNGLGI